MTSKVLSLLFVFHQFPLICANTISLYKYLVVVLKRYIIKGKNILYSIQRIIIAIAIAHATNCILFLLSLPAKIYLRTKLELKSHESSTIIINVCETRLLISHKTLDNLAMHHPVKRFISDRVTLSKSSTRKPKTTLTKQLTYYFC